MEQTFFEHYRICNDEDESPKQISRTGAAINYKGIDTRSKNPVTLQLIPLAIIDPTKREQLEERVRAAQRIDHVNAAKILAVGAEQEYFAIVSEYLEGEPADSWVVAHGPMPPDAVLRVGLQVVRAITAAAFFGLTHRAIQPWNLMIVPGQAPDGGWPFVKVINFGLAGLELHSASTEARELAPSVAPQFASPEQLADREIDFRSEIYSLGATMCFLLTGAVPLAVGGMKTRLRLGQLPELRRAPRALRKLLAQMLRKNPQNRPQDPVAFEAEMRNCLTKIERRQAIGRKLGIPLAAVVARKPKSTREPRTPLEQVLRGIVASAVLLAAATVLGAYFFPDIVPLWHRGEKIGVRVGVPDVQATGLVANQSVTSSPANADQNPPSVAVPSQRQTATAGLPTVAGSSSSTPMQTTPLAPTSQPAPAAEGPGGESTAAKNSSQNRAASSTQSSGSSARNKKKTTASASNRTSTSKRARFAQAWPDEPELYTPRLHSRWPRGRVIGRTPDGRPILRLPSGRIVIVTPQSDYEDAFLPPPRRRVFIERPDIFVPPPPFYPPGYFPND